MSAVLAFPTQSERARILDVTLEEYHADPCETPSLNQSIARVLLQQSPMHAYAAHPRLGNVQKKPTKVQIEGTVIHALLLGRGEEDVEILDYPDYKTKVAQVARDKIFAEGRTPVLRCKYDEIVVAAEAIRANLAAQGCVFKGGMAEVTIEWWEEGPEGPVRCRGRLDYLIRTERGVRIIDPKKITSADPTTCMYHADDYGHHIQAAAYTSAVEKLWPEYEGRVEFMFGFHELEAPYAAVPRVQSPLSVFVGQQQWRRAVAIWQQCLSTGVWPGYIPEPLDVSQRTLAQEEALAEEQLLATSTR